MTAGRIDVIDTMVGPAQVLHRLALAVECLDATTGLRTRTDVAVGREVDPRLLPRKYPPAWPCVSLESKGTGLSQLRFDATTPVTTPIRLRLADPARRFVARRFDLPLWRLPEILTAEAAPPTVPATSRLLRPWLWPATGALLPRGSTVVRGVVRSAAGPVRWARLTAVRPADGPVGHGHADDRGEFLVVINNTGALPPPAPSTLDVDLVVTAPDPATAPPPDAIDRYADLVVEPLARSSNPPLPAELDNAVLRGTTTPPGYIPNTAVVPTLTVPVGAELTLTAAIPFAP
jgi:hypothetical protein